MADYYLRQGEYPAYSATPSGSGWPLPAQDGDGLGTGLAVSASGAISFAGVTAAAGNTLAIMGAVLTCVASGATTNQFNAATGSALATNVAAAINAATATVNAGTSAATPQLRDMLYARVNPGTNTEVQIMTRPGSAALNHASNSAVAITSAGFGVAPTITQFAGGASGAWGYLWTTSGTIWPSGKAVRTYGCVFSGSTSRPLVGPDLTIDDWVIQRGSNAIVSTGTGALAFTVAVNAWINLLVDDGTVWPGSTGALTLRYELAAGSAEMTLRFDPAGSITSPRPVVWASAAPEKLVFDMAVPNGQTGALNIYAGASNLRGLVLENVLFDEGTSGPTSTAKFGIGIASNASIRVVGGRWVFRRNNFYNIWRTDSASSERRVEFLGTTFEWTSLASAPGALIQVGAASRGGGTFKLANCGAIGASPQVFSVGAGAFWHRYNFFAKNMPGFSLATTLMGQMGASASTAEDTGACLLQNVGAGNAFRLETCMHVVDWLPGQGYPTLTAVLGDGTPWSMRLLLSAAENAARYGGATELQSFAKRYEAAPAVATVTLELYVPSAMASQITEGHLGVMLSYTDSTGVQRSERASWPARPRSSTTALAASSASWTANSFGGYVARKISAATQYAVKQGTDIDVSLYQRRPMPSQVELFIDPDVGLS